MSNFRGIFSLEENQELLETLPVDDTSVEASLLEATEAQADIDETTEQVQQAETVEDTLTEMNAAATPEEKVEIATEALLQLVGYKYRSKFSLEEFSTRLDTNVSIAQEGMFDKLKEYAGSLTTTQKKLNSDMKAALQNLKDKGTIEGEITKLLYSQHLSLPNSKEVNHDSIMKVLKEHDSILNASAISSHFKEINKFFEKVINGKELTEEDFKGLSTSAEKTLVKITSTKIVEVNKNPVSITPVTYKDADSIVKEIEDIRNKIDKNLTDSVGLFKKLIMMAKKNDIAIESFSEEWIFELSKTLTSVGFWVLFVLGGFSFLSWLWLIVAPLVRAAGNVKKNKGYAAEDYKTDYKKEFDDAMKNHREIIKICRDNESALFKTNMGVLKLIEASSKK